MSSSLSVGAHQQKVSMQLLEEYAAEDSEFLHSIMTVDKSWFLHFNPGRK
jgi:hypothetical protein